MFKENKTTPDVFLKREHHNMVKTLERLYNIVQVLKDLC